MATATTTTSTPTTAGSDLPLPSSTSFEVYVSKDTFKFNAAHFVAFSGYRERLHGHNYRVGVRLLGQRTIGADGYLIDFGCIKAVCKSVCKRLNEHFICPMHSNVLNISVSDSSVRIECMENDKDALSVFVFPQQDCAMLPIVHATTEEIAIFLWSEILKGLHAEYLRQRGIHTMEVTVAEDVGQEATFRWPIPAASTFGSDDCALDVRAFISQGHVVPMPCPSAEKKPTTTSNCCPNCQGSSNNNNNNNNSGCAPMEQPDFSEQLERIAQAINRGEIKGDGSEAISAMDLERLFT
jgi:dihydroneopterin triphosphate aldolase (PTPS-III) / 6-pyruvoyltetrahydropterin synthase